MPKSGAVSKPVSQSFIQHTIIIKACDNKVAIADTRALTFTCLSIFFIVLEDSFEYHMIYVCCIVYRETTDGHLHNFAAHAFNFFELQNYTHSFGARRKKEHGLLVTVAQ